jgi:hypothetical protein
VPLKGGIYAGNMLRINLAFARSSLFLVCFSSSGWDGTTRALDEEVGSHLVDDACTPIYNPLSDMTLSVIKSRSTSDSDFMRKMK